MFEFGMSALVLKICQEYAQATGLNFPPCVQQEVNAIAQWVSKHTVKDLDITQDGNTVTFKFTEDKTEPTVFTIELPEEYVLNVDDLYNLIKGSSSVVVDKSADGKTLVVRLDKSQEVQYITLSPDSATQGTLTVEQFTALQLNKGNCIILNNEIYRLADNQHTTGVISYVHTGWDSNIVNKSINITVSTRAWTMVVGQSSGGGKLYRHAIYIEGEDGSGAAAAYNGIIMSGYFYSSSNRQKTIADFWNGNFLGINRILINNPTSPAYLAYNYTVISEELEVIGLFYIKVEGEYVVYDANPTSVRGYTFKFTDTVTEV